MSSNNSNRIIHSGEGDQGEEPNDAVESSTQQSIPKTESIDPEKNVQPIEDDKEDPNKESKVIPTTSYEPEKPQSKKEYKELAVATAVPFESSSELYYANVKENIKKGAIVTAEYDPVQDDREKPFCRRYAIIIWGCCILGIVLIVLLTVLLIPTKNDCSGPSNCPDKSPTMAPTESPTMGARETNIMNYLVQEFSMNVVIEGTAYSMALDWILYQDLYEAGFGVGVDRKTWNDLTNRFALAVFYFSSTGNEFRPWRSCSAPYPAENNSTCTYLEPSLSPDGVSIQYRELPGIRWLSGTDHCQWQGVVCDNQGEVLRIDISGQGIQGNLEQILKGDKDSESTTNILLKAFPNLQVLDLSFNELTGSLPSSFADFPALLVLELHNNALIGSIPSSYFQNLLSLQLLNLGYNQLSGTLATSIGRLDQLRGLHLLQNNFRGTIPSEIGSLFRLLTHSRIDGNEFSGQLPTEVGQLTNLVRFEYSNNLLTGTIPTELGRLTNMDFFRLDGNELSGTIPVEICSMINARLIMLDGNELSGPLPTTELLQLQRLQRFQVNRNRLTGAIPTELGSIPSLRLAWLHLNEFTGPVPVEVCQAASTGTGLSVLQADCAPVDDPANPCRCCTACCDRSTEVCLATR